MSKTPLKTKLRAGKHRLVLSGPQGSRKIEVRIKADETQTVHEAFKMGKVNVLSRPWSEVFMGGGSRGKTPVSFSAFTGPQTITLGNEAGDRLTRDVVVKAGETVDIRVRF